MVNVEYNPHGSVGLGANKRVLKRVGFREQPPMTIFKDKN